MQGFMNSMTLHPGRTILAVMAINIVIFLGGLAAVAVAIRWALTGQLF